MRAEIARSRHRFEDEVERDMYISNDAGRAAWRMHLELWNGLLRHDGFIVLGLKEMLDR